MEDAAMISSMAQSGKVDERQSGYITFGFGPLLRLSPELAQCSPDKMYDD